MTKLWELTTIVSFIVLTAQLALNPLAMKPLHLMVNSTELIEGQLRAFDVDGQSILMVRVGGTPYAMLNSCPHAGSRLETGKLTGKILKCPSHGLSFDITTGKHNGTASCPPLTILEVTQINSELAIRMTDSDANRT